MTFQPECGDGRRPGIAAGSCQWCGRKLRKFYRYGFHDAAGKLLQRAARQDTGKLGGYGDNAFCGLSCGYQWARREIARQRPGLGT